MTGHQINSLVGDLVAMAQAMERLPQVERNYEEALIKISEWTSRYDLLALDLEQARAYAATLEAKVHEAEVAKDAAETMFLEADDRTSRALDFIKATFGNAGSLIQALEPVKEEPRPLEHTSSSGHTEDVSSGQAPVGSIAPNDASPTQGQSEPGPIEALPEVYGLGIMSYADGSASTNSGAGPTPTDTPPTPPAKPYLYLRYKDYPAYVSFNDWLEGGGTEYDYSN